jgi:hypothetical protein
VIHDSSSFTDCQSLEGNGGGIYAEIILATNSYFKVLDSTFTGCIATKTSDPSIRRGFGSGLLIKITNWNSFKDGIDLSGAIYTEC